MILHCLLEGRLSASQEELLVGSGKEQGSRRLRVRKLEVRLKVHVIAWEGKHCPCHHRIYMPLALVLLSVENA